MFFDKKKIKVFVISSAMAGLCGLALFFGIKALRFYRQHKNCQNVVILRYGLGNQLFNFAFGYALEKETGSSVCYVKRQPKEHETHEDDMMKFYRTNAKFTKFKYAQRYRFLPKTIRQYLTYFNDSFYKKKRKFFIQ